MDRIRTLLGVNIRSTSTLAVTSLIIVTGTTYYYWYYHRSLKRSRILTPYTSSSSSSSAHEPLPRRTIALLIDNGSLRPASIITLRNMAAELQQRIDNRIPVIAASARISNRIPVKEIQEAYAANPFLFSSNISFASSLSSSSSSAFGTTNNNDHHPIEQPLIVETAIQRYYAQGYTHYLIVPAFLGPSETITEFIPEVFQKVSTLLSSSSSSSFSPITYQVGRPLVNIPPSTTTSTSNNSSLNVIDSSHDTRIARILIDHINQVWEKKQCSTANIPPSIAICDHGSPSYEVTAVRNYITHQIQQLQSISNVFPQIPRSITACSMERRPDKIYDYNEPLLERLLVNHPDYKFGNIIVGMLFISPGKHAGNNGDVATIIQNSLDKNTKEGCRAEITMTPLLGTHSLLMDILVERLQEIMEPKKENVK